MDLSVVIVNYNVRDLLEQCLLSVRKASENLGVEVFVVDNASADGSIQMIKQKFPEVKCMANLENVGFAKANNQAINKAVGEFVLLLNPDTVVEADTFVECIRFMSQTPDAGALGVKMLDGKGRFLPESKRALPTPWVSFCKISGLTKFFPKSKRYGRYYMAWLDPDQIHSVDVLSGAFMLLRKEVLNHIGLLDESYFMYGEDIDLSYRVTLGGYKNYYYPKTRIIHYKGESTKKGSLNYVLVFYGAMQIFARKYFAKSGGKMFSLMIQAAIWLRAIYSLFYRIFSRILFPLLDTVLIFGFLYLFQKQWSTYYFQDPGHFPSYFANWVLPLYALMWVASLAGFGAYKVPIRAKSLLYGVLAGGALLLLVHSVLGQDWYFSRMVLVVATISLFPLLWLFRRIGSLFIPSWRIYSSKKKTCLILGSMEENERVSCLLKEKGVQDSYIHSFDISNYPSADSIKGMIEEYRRLYKIEELLFCAESMRYAHIIELMSACKMQGLAYRIVSPEGRVFL